MIQRLSPQEEHERWIEFVRAITATQINRLLFHGFRIAETEDFLRGELHCFSLAQEVREN